MKITIKYIWIILCLIPYISHAQRFAEETWHEGKVILLEGDTIQGSLRFALKDEIVQVQTPQNLQTYTSRKVLSFTFFDRLAKRDRTFYSFNFAKTPNYETPTFFELLLQGKPNSLLGRETLVKNTQFVNPGPWGTPMNPMGMGTSIPITTFSVKMEMYLLLGDGRIKSFDGTKKRLLFLLKDKEKEIKDYIKKNSVNFNSPNDISRIVQYYNLLKNKNK
jgi:hypothetical protein